VLADNVASQPVPPTKGIHLPSRLRHGVIAAATDSVLAFQNRGIPAHNSVSDTDLRIQHLRTPG